MEPHVLDPANGHVGIVEAAGWVGVVQVALGVAVVVYAARLAWRPPAHAPGTKLLVGVVGACMPFVVGHFGMLVAQMGTYREMTGAGAAASERELVLGMEAASVQTWVGWTASGVALAAVLLAGLRLPKS